MAQIKRRKVSDKATKHIKRDKKPLYKKKKFWIGLSSFLVACVGIVVCIALIIHFKNDSSDDEREVLDYFYGESSELDEKVNKDLVKDSREYDENYKPKFQKISLDGIKMHANAIEGDANTFIEYMFIYACDLSTYYPDEHIDDDIDEDEDEKLYNKTDYSVYKELTYLQYSIDKENKRLQDLAIEEDGEDGLPAYQIRLYIVDTDDAENSVIYQDSLFGLSDDSDVQSSMFALLNNGKIDYNEKKNDKKESQIYACGDQAKIASTCVNKSVEYMLNGFKKSN